MKENEYKVEPRQEEKELDKESNEKENSDKEMIQIDDRLFSKFDISITDCEITEMDDLPTVEILEVESPFTKSYSEFIRTNKAMLWHVRMGHASVSSLKKLQKIWENNKELKDVKFGDSILDCKVCLITKITFQY